MVYVVYDSEIIKCIPPKEGSPDPTLDYCLGWDDHSGMGISVVAVGIVSTFYTTYRAFVLDPKVNPDVPSTIDELSRCLSSGFLVGFNSKKHDDNLLAAEMITDQGLRFASFDLLRAIRLAAFGNAEWTAVPSGYSYSLDKLAKANHLGGKTGSGEFAPKLWQRKQYQQVIDYCVNDVALTVKILDLGVRGQLIDPNTGNLLRIDLSVIDP